MRLIGYWLRDLKDEEFCLPQEVVGDLPSEVRAQLASYLDAGAPYESYRGHSWCRFFCGLPPEGLGSGERTDGLWVWPDGLSHYVRAHNITLPEDFLRHALSRTAPPDNPAITSLDLDYWRRWCAVHRSPTVLDRLSKARAAADKLIEEQLDQWAAEKVAKLGLSDQGCLWMGCIQPALKGTYVCAKHSLGDTEVIKRGFYVIQPEHVA